MCLSLHTGSTIVQYSMDRFFRRAIFFMFCKQVWCEKAQDMGRRVRGIAGQRVRDFSELNRDADVVLIIKSKPILPDLDVVPLHAI